MVKKKKTAAELAEQTEAGQMTRTVDKRPRVGTDDAHGIAVFMMQRCQKMHLYGNNESLYNAAKTLTAGPGQEAKRRESHPKRIKLRKIRKLSFY